MAIIHLESRSNACGSEGAEDVLRNILLSAVERVRKWCLADPKKKQDAPRDGTNPVQVWDPCGKAGSEQPPDDEKGRLFSVAAMVLMTFMYQARTARLTHRRRSDSWRNVSPVGIRRLMATFITSCVSSTRQWGGHREVGLETIQHCWLHSFS